jgi:hypothetical protein
MAQDMDKGWAVVNTVMNTSGATKQGDFVSGCGNMACQNGCVVG